MSIHAYGCFHDCEYAHICISHDKTTPTFVTVTKPNQFSHCHWSTPMY